MMRYQRVSPDCLPPINGKKPNLRTCKEEDAVSENNSKLPNYSTFEGKAPRFRSGTTTQSPSQDQNFSQFANSDLVQPENHSTKNQTNEGSSGGGDVLLQWGHNKRSRGSRADYRLASDESLVQRQMIKIHRRVAVVGSKKPATNRTVTMPPPPCSAFQQTGGYSRGANLRPCTPLRESGGSSLPNRNSEDRSGPANGSPSSNGGNRILPRSAEKRSPTSPEKTASCPVTEKPNGSTVHGDPLNHESTTPSEPEASLATEKLNLDQFEWPRIYISLSRKEKEDDFLAMKGTKLPQRPKKRAKNIDKTLQYCFPGMWLSDLTRGRYEVREKKCVKKKRRGLKGMESMDSDSE
eukprot:TRINITY_DN10605_c0_g1_i1.p1 TRINITY_DN10605_c0_g1~~TRINITY_DN10605_c0_g1_i1.p1  ORF type:complete len:351 (-),score=45.86 TRINITY_DN10605_c0_g1_i1:180-1232(-)